MGIISKFIHWIFDYFTAKKLQIFALLNKEKNLQFNGVKQSKIQWMDLEIKFIKGKNFFKNWEAENQKVGFKNLERYIKIETKICNFLVQMNQKSDGQISK